jgi:hypothetical protein
MHDGYGIPDQFFGPVPGQFYAVVGRVTMLGALLEQRVLELLWAVDEGPQALHAGKPVTQLLKLIEGRLGPQSDDIREDAHEVLAGVKSALEDRNAIVHSLWPEPSLRIAFRWRPRTLKRREAAADWVQGQFVTRKDLRGVVSHLVAVNNEVSSLTQRFHSARKIP